MPDLPSEAQGVADTINSLSEKTPDMVFRNTQDYGERAIAAAAAAAGGGSGSGGEDSSELLRSKRVIISDQVPPWISDDPDHASLKIYAAVGGVANEQNLIEFYNDDGEFLFYLDATGSIRSKLLDGAVFRIDNGTGGETIFRAQASSEGSKLGFFGASPVTQPAAPTSVQEIADTLAALGLVAPGGVIT